MDLGKTIRTVSDFPKEGILFYDITTLLKDGKAFDQAVDWMVSCVKDKKVDVVVGIESRGFIFGSAVALKLGVGFVPVRKPGKLPAKKSSGQIVACSPPTTITQDGLINFLIKHATSTELI